MSLHVEEMENPSWIQAQTRISPKIYSIAP